MKHPLLLVFVCISIQLHAQETRYRAAAMQWKQKNAVELDSSTLDSLAREMELAADYFAELEGDSALVRAVADDAFQYYLDKRFDGRKFNSAKNVLGARLAIRGNQKFTGDPLTINAYGKLKIKCTPDSARVFVNGVFRSYSYNTLVLSKGKHVILVRYTPDYKDFTQSITIVPAEINNLKITLKKLP